MASVNTDWATVFGAGSQLAVSDAVAIDGSGDVIAGGSFAQAIDFGGGQLTNHGPFVAMFGPSGAYQWAHAFGGSGASGAVTTLAVDATGVVAAGWFMGTINLGGGNLDNMGSTPEIFVVRLDSSGNYVWSDTFGDGTNNAQLGSMALDDSGDLVLAGTFTRSITLGGTTLAATGPASGADAGSAPTGDFVVELDALTGDAMWSSDAPSTSNILAAVDGAGNVFVAGAFKGTIDFGGTTLTSAGGNDIAVAKLDPNGSPLWSQSFGSSQDDSALGLAVDSAGDVVLAGLPGASLALGGGTLPGGSTFLVKLDGGGNYVWGNPFGGSAVLQTMVADGTDILAGGVASGDLTFGGGLLASAGSSIDLLVMKLDGSGNWVWGLRASGSSAAAHQIAVNGAHQVAVAGSCGSGSLSLGTGSPSCGGGICALVAELGP